jgi:hypothetical protein
MHQSRTSVITLPEIHFRRVRLTEPEDTLIRYLSPSTDHVSHMTLGKLIIAQIDGGHPFLLQGSDDLSNLLRSGLGGDGG